RDTHLGATAIGLAVGLGVFFQVAAGTAQAPVRNAEPPPAASAAAASPTIPPAPAYPLKVSANRRYLVDQNDRPFLIVGDSPQTVIGKMSEADAEFYVANRQRHGVNAL